jgi:hypothetical protein
MANGNIFIAKRKGQRTHVFLRAYRKEALEDVEYTFNADGVDKLLMAQDPESFAYAVASFYPLSLEPLCAIEINKLPRKQTVQSFRNSAQNVYEFIDEALLMEEFTGIKDDGTELNKSSLKRAAKDFDAMRGGNFERFLIENAFSDFDYVVAEPILDWTAAKALLSNIVLFQAFANADANSLNFDEIATHNGYWVYGKVFDKRIKERVKQFVYNASWRNETVGGLIAEVFDPTSQYCNDPLLSQYCEWELHKLNVTNNKCRLKNSEHICFKGAQSINGQALSFFAKARREVVDRSLYLVADLSCSEPELAHEFASAVIKTTMELKSYKKGKPLGWEYDFSVSVEQAATPKPIFYSQIAELIYDVAFHKENLQSVVCKGCGRPMLNQVSTKPRQFCRASCKTTYCTAHKADHND